MKMYIIDKYPKTVEKDGQANKAWVFRGCSCGNLLPNISLGWETRPLYTETLSTSGSGKRVGNAIWSGILDGKPPQTIATMIS